MSAKPVLAAFSMHAFLILSFPLFIRSVALSGEIDCLKCHDKSMFTGKVVHPALGMGCTSCHTPQCKQAEPVQVWGKLDNHLRGLS